MYEAGLIMFGVAMGLGSPVIFRVLRAALRRHGVFWVDGVQSDATTITLSNEFIIPEGSAVEVRIKE